MKAPLTMPVSGLSLQAFEIDRLDYLSPEAGGRLGGVQAGFPKWGATWTIGKIGPDKSEEFRSFFAELRGAMRAFYGADLRRPFPKAYPDGFSAMTRFDGTPFTGAAASWSMTIDGNDDCPVTLHGLPSGFVLGTGDYVGFRWDAVSDEVAGLPWRHLSRVIRGGGGVADGGGVVTVKVEPPVPTVVPSGATAHFDNPCCVMRLVTASSKLDAIDRRGAVTGGTIVAEQDLRP